ncbi:MAG: hypothetical protein AAGI52_14935 [Bacteroidota bacterium]
MATTSRLVRKQLSLTAEHNRELKRRSRALGISESEIVRRALDAALSENIPSRPDSDLAKLLDHTRQLAKGRRLDGPIDRDTLHDRA